MLGYNTMREVLVWVELEESEFAEIIYWKEGSEDSIRLNKEALSSSLNYWNREQLIITKSAFPT